MNRDVHNMIFIVVEHSGCYTEQDWTVVSVNQTLKDAQIAGWSAMVDEGLLPHKLNCFKNYCGEYADLINLSEYHIEQWEFGAPKRTCAYFLGDKDTIETFLRDNEELCLDILLEWKSKLEKGIIPNECQCVRAAEN